MTISNLFSEPFNNYLRSTNVRTFAQHCCIGCIVTTATLEITGIYTAIYPTPRLREANLAAQSVVYVVSLAGILAMRIDNQLTRKFETTRMLEVYEIAKTNVEKVIEYLA